jgi:hypothetical protein
MCRPGTLAALALVAVAAGCFGGSGASHRTLTAAEALHQARADGFTRVSRPAGQSWRCRSRLVETGPRTTVGQYASYRRATYALQFGDKRLPNVDDNTAQIAMYATVLPDAALAARCARAGRYEADHVSVEPPGFAEPGSGPMRVIPHRTLGPTTIVTHMHASGGPGSLYPDDGDYQTYLARGRVLAFGLAHTRKASLIVQADLGRIAAQIADG